MAARCYDIQSQAYKRNPYPTLWEMIEAGPMVRIKIPMIGSYRAVTPYDAVSDLLRDRKRFVRDPRSAGLRMGDLLPWWFPRSMRPMASTMIIRDEPDHRRLRRLVEKAFLRQSIERMRGRLEIVADNMLDELVAEQKRSGKPVDLVAGLARPFPLAVICELLGLPQSDRPRFVRQAEYMTRLSLWRLPGLYRAMTGMLAYIREQIALRRAEPAEGLITELIAAEEEGDQLSEDELVSMVLLLLFAGHVTTVHLIGGGIHTLLAHPEQKQALMADWSKAERAIDEILRYLSPVQITKPMMPAQDMEWRGQTLKRGKRSWRCWRRQTRIRRSSSIRSASISSGIRIPTWPSAWEFTFAWAGSWPRWRRRSPCSGCSRDFRTWRKRIPPNRRNGRGNSERGGWKYCRCGWEHLV